MELPPNYKNRYFTFRWSTADLDASTTPYMRVINLYTNLNDENAKYIVNKHLHYNFKINCTPTTGVSQTYNVSVIYDRRPVWVGVNYTFPAYTDIFTAASPLAPPNLAYADRFDIVYTRVAVINASSVEHSAHAFAVEIPLDDRITVHLNTAGTSNGHTKGTMFISVITDQPPGVTAAKFNAYHCLTYRPLI